jgi:hypothetical protein
MQEEKDYFVKLRGENMKLSENGKMDEPRLVQILHIPTNVVVEKV